MSGTAAFWFGEYTSERAIIWKASFLVRPSRMWKVPWPPTPMQPTRILLFCA